jgi:hypothetical protein
MAKGDFATALIIFLISLTQAIKSPMLCRLYLMKEDAWDAFHRSLHQFL